MTTATELTGRELDAAVAERVMGDTVGYSPRIYSTDIAAAMSVIANLEKDNMIVLAHMSNINSEGLWSVSLSSNTPGYIDVRGEAATLPEAICRAALLAVDGKESK